MEKSIKAFKRDSYQEDTTLTKVTAPEQDRPRTWKYIYFLKNVNGRSKDTILKARIKLRHYRTIIVSKKTPFQDSRLQKIKRWILQGSFMSLVKNFRKVDISNDFIEEILFLMPKVTMLRDLSIEACAPRTSRKLDNFGFQAKALRKYFKLKQLEKFCIEGSFLINRSKEFALMTRVLTKMRNLNVLNMSLSVESLIKLTEHQGILKHAPHRFRRLPKFSNFLIPNLGDARIKENAIRFYAKFLADSHIKVLRLFFDRNNYDSQMVLLHVASRSPKLRKLSLELKLNTSYSNLVLNQVNVSLKGAPYLTSLSLSIHAPYDVNLIVLLKALAQQKSLKVFQLILDKDEYSKEEIKDLTLCLDHLTNLTDLTLVLSSGLWKNVDEFTLTGIYDGLKKPNLKSANLKLTCESSSDLMSYFDKKKYFDNLCKYLPILISKVQKTLIGLSLSLQLEYFEEFQIPFEVLNNVFVSISKMTQLNRLIIKIFGLPRLDRYPRITGLLNNLSFLNEVYIHLDFLAEEELPKLLNRLASLEDLKRLYLGSKYLELQESSAKLIIRFLKKKKGISRKKFGFECKDPSLMKMIERIR